MTNGPATAQWLLSGVTTASAGHYWCEVTFDGALHASNAVMVEVQPHVSITTPPVGGDAERGGSHTFTVVVSGGYGSLVYQWKQDGKDVHDAYDSVFKLTDLDFGDSGEYTVEISDTNGDTIESVPVRLSVPAGLPVAGMGGLALLAAALTLVATRRRS